MLSSQSGQLEQPAEFGLLAVGAAGRWTVCLDETLADGGLILEFDGPHLYLSVTIDGPDMIERLVTFLNGTPRERPASTQPTDTADGEMVIGRLDGAPVLLLRDTETANRCWVMVGSGAGTVLRVTLQPEDSVDVLSALRQLLEDI